MARIWVQKSRLPLRSLCVRLEPGSNSLVIYAVDQETGELSVVGHESSQGIGPRDFTIDPSGALLLVANQDTDTVVTFWINQESGMLTATGHVTKVPTPVCLLLHSV